MKNLYFERSNGQYLLIRENIADEQEAMKEIDIFLKKHNYQSYYTRMWYENEGTVAVFDVGSWSEFFKLASPNVISAVGTEEDFIGKKEIESE